PYGERPLRYVVLVLSLQISIHAPLTGSDASPISWRNLVGDFNPRSPYGERRGGGKDDGEYCNFNPRSPYGERPKFSKKFSLARYFNPRSPYGERPKFSKK